MKLTSDSRRFLQEIQRSTYKRTQDNSRTEKIQNLLQELNGIMEQARQHLIGLTAQEWTSTNEKSEILGDASYIFEFYHSESPLAPRIKISISLLSASCIEVIPKHEISNFSSDTLNAFYSSPAFKRYFKMNESESHGLRAKFSKKQLSSRYFGGYINHLISMAFPLINEHLQKSRKALAA